MKRCTHCEQIKNESDFSSNKTHKDGLNSVCRTCNTEYQRQYRQTENGKEKLISGYKKYRQTEKGKATQRKADIRRAMLYPDTVIAVNAVNNAIRAGKLKREPCELCGTEYKIQAHHHDYNQPLNVMWLCKQCHTTLHGVI